MTPDQRAEFERAIIDGRLIDAIKVYRSATGAPLDDAKRYVEACSAALRFGTTTPSEPPLSGASRPSSAAAWWVGGCLALCLVILACFVWFVYTAVRTHGFGLFSAVREPYYSALVSRITRDPAFVRELGTPIRVDDSGVFCSSIDDTMDSQKATCQLPVSGPHGTGHVHAVIDDEDGDLSTKLDLHVGDRLIRASS